jgi:TATA-binding protein-associated factor Taf7
VPTIPTEFGAINVLPLPGNAGSVTISNIVPQFQEGGFVATLPFSGNAISLHNIDGEPFVASYSVAADVETGLQRADDISAAETSTEQQAIEEEAEDESEDNENGDNDGGDNGNGDGSEEEPEEESEVEPQEEPKVEPQEEPEETPTV